ncbi:hypothetical protein AB0E63_25410 [Kribbella sp. NPDC026596]
MRTVFRVLALIWQRQTTKPSEPKSPGWLSATASLSWRSPDRRY